MPVRMNIRFSFPQIYTIPANKKARFFRALIYLLGFAGLGFGRVHGQPLYIGFEVWNVEDIDCTDIRSRAGNVGDIESDAVVLDAVRTNKGFAE